MARTRLSRAKRARTIAASRRDGGPITRREFDRVIRLLNERRKKIDDLRSELRDTCRELADSVRRELQTQFTRIAQLQQEIDVLKRAR